MILRLNGSRKATYSDMEVVRGLQSRDKRTEEWFYHVAHRYFDDHFNEVFFDKDKKQEIFQTAFLKLWMEISNGRIGIIGERVCRQQQSGEYKVMTCSLTTFLMAFARTEYRELVRNTREDYYGELYDDTLHVHPDHEDDEDEQRHRIVDDCIQQMAPRCIEILTLFYYKGMSLDEIMEARQEHNTSKNGLKTAKNKCMNTLRERIITEFRKYRLNV